MRLMTKAISKTIPAIGTTSERPAEQVRVDLETKRRAVVEVLRAILETIQEAGPEGVACGTLYGVLAAQGCSKADYDTIERALLDSKRVTKRGDRLVVGDRRVVDLRDQDR